MTQPAETVDGEVHPYFAALKHHCAIKPDALEDHPWGETVFKIRGKIFAFLGLPASASVTVKSLPDDLDGLLALPFVRKASYIGRYGWITLDIEDEQALELALELVDVSFEIIGSKTKRRKSA